MEDTIKYESLNNNFRNLLLASGFNEEDAVNASQFHTSYVYYVNTENEDPNNKLAIIIQPHDVSRFKNNEKGVIYDMKIINTRLIDCEIECRDVDEYDLPTILSVAQHLKDLDAI